MKKYVVIAAFALACFVIVMSSKGKKKKVQLYNYEVIIDVTYTNGDRDTITFRADKMRELEIKHTSFENVPIPSLFYLSSSSCCWEIICADVRTYQILEQKKNAVSIADNEVGG